MLYAGPVKQQSRQAIARAQLRPRNLLLVIQGPARISRMQHQSHSDIGGTGRGRIEPNPPFGCLGIIVHTDAMGPIMIPGAEAFKAAYQSDNSNAVIRDATCENSSRVHGKQINPIGAELGLGVPAPRRKSRMATISASFDTGTVNTKPNGGCTG